VESAELQRSTLSVQTCSYSPWLWPQHETNGHEHLDSDRPIAAYLVDSHSRSFSVFRYLSPAFCGRTCPAISTAFSLRSVASPQAPPDATEEHARLAACNPEIDLTKPSDV